MVTLPMPSIQRVALQPLGRSVCCTPRKSRQVLSSFCRTIAQRVASTSNITITRHHLLVFQTHTRDCRPAFWRAERDTPLGPQAAERAAGPDWHRQSVGLW
jgi:hypothetical protein